MKKKILARLHVLEILSKNKTIILKHKVHLYKRLKKL
jgi:hypothetical protein